MNNTVRLQYFIKKQLKKDTIKVKNINQKYINLNTLLKKETSLNPNRHLSMSPSRKK